MALAGVMAVADGYRSQTQSCMVNPRARVAERFAAPERFWSAVYSLGDGWVWCGVSNDLREAQVTARQVCSASQRPPHQHLRGCSASQRPPHQHLRGCSASQRPPYQQMRVPSDGAASLLRVTAPTSPFARLAVAATHIYHVVSYQHVSGPVTAPSERLQGTVDVLILKTLAWKPNHGYAIAQFLANHSEGELSVEGAALYQGLHRLERKGLVRSRWGVSDTNRRVRVYSLTPEGRKQLTAEADGWKRYAAAVARVLALKDANA
jgi:PadR family transcriptional regulator PadR